MVGVPDDPLAPCSAFGARFTRRGDYASLTAILKGRFIYVGSFEVEHD